MAEKTKISERLDENIAHMEELFHTCDDIKKKRMNLGKKRDVACYLTFIEVSVDMGNSALLEVLKYLRGLEREEILRVLEQNALGTSDATYFTTIEEAGDGLLTGEAVFFVDGFAKAVKIPDDGYPNMGINEADSEKVVRGSNEGFGDSVKTECGVDPQENPVATGQGKREKNGRALQHQRLSGLYGRDRLPGAGGKD